jgi:uncharacterized protein YjiS (DUF1127 family)
MIALPHSVFASETRPTRQPILLRLLLAVEGWAERLRQRRALLALNDHALKDIGLSYADAWQEGRKPFWRE